MLVDVSHLNSYLSRVKNKPKIVVFIDWYVPAYKAGGPIRSVYNLVETLKEVFDFYVITSTIDIDGEKLSPIKENEWEYKKGVHILYLSPEAITRKRIKKEVKKIQPFKIYLNSLFSTKFTLLPLQLFRDKYSIVVAPRGMLGKESLAIKASKKKVFLALAKALNLYTKVTWHVSSEIERGEVEAVFGKKTKIKIARNLTLVTDEFTSIPKKKGVLKMLMVGRVVPIKNVHFFLKELRQLAQEAKVEVVIVGPLEDELYYDECRQLIKGLSSNVKVEFKGGLPPIKVVELYKNYHLLVSTSLNENYGHSIAEALTHGRPILVSNNTPWKKLKELGIGANLPLEQGGFAKEIQRFVEMEEGEFETMQKKAKAYALEYLKSEEEIQKSVRLFC